MDDDQKPSGDGTPQRGFGQRRRGGRVRRPASGGPPAGNRPPRRDFDPGPPRARAAATPEPESVKPARELLEQILVRMGVAGAHVRYYARSEGEYLEVDGPDLANLIGRHGHTLEALNLIFNNIVNAGVKKDRHYFTIDAEGYRARRADLLKGLALQTLERAIREKRSISLEPMLPSERKVIHLALADNPYVSTESSGVEPERRVVVIPRSS
jgi:spoIIIJ-associated protein